MRRVALLALGLVLATGTAAHADPPRHRHLYYPAQPSGKSQIVATFGQPCNANARASSYSWRAADNGVLYAVRYHYKLGIGSTNFLDIRYHIEDQNLDRYVRHGIWGYNCRYIRGTTKWSTHAWGIAIDVNSAYEHVKHFHCHTVPSALGSIFRTHYWKWGLDWGDCMHFQYARNY